MLIEKGTEKDLLEIMYLLQHCIGDFNGNGVYQWNISYPDYPRLQNEIEQGDLYIIRSKGVIIGTITLSEEQESVFEAVNWKNKTDKFIIIRRVAVFPAWQRKGVGTKLVKFAEEYARENGYKSLRLDVASSSEYLIKLYESLGYECIGDVSYPKQKETFKCLEKIVA